MTPEEARKLVASFLPPGEMSIVPDLDKSQGNYLHDAVSGQAYLDCFSYFASNPVGHNHPGLNDPEFEKKLLRTAKSKPSSSDFYTVEMAEFVEAFSRYAKKDPFKYAFFISGGGIAVANALKAAFDWKVRLNRKNNLGDGGSDILHFRQAFHGRTGYTLSLTNTADPRKTALFPQFDWPRVSNPKCKFPLEGENLKDTQDREKESIAQIERAFAERGGRIAAIIIEPIQGEGGDNHFRPEFHAELRRLADENGALLIYDEVQTGVGLTGTFWAYEQLGVTPDIVCFGKKMQVCGFMAGPRMDEVKDHVFVEASRINSTWGGNLVDMVRAGRYLQIIEQENLIQNAATMGKVVLEKLQYLCDTHPQMLSQARGRGLMCAFDVDSPQRRDAIVREAIKRNLLILSCGTHSIRLRPSLTFSLSEVNEMAGRLQESVEAVR